MYVANIIILLAISVGGVFGVLAMLKSSFPHPSLPVITILVIVVVALGLLLIVPIVWALVVFCDCCSKTAAEPRPQDEPKTQDCPANANKEIGKWERFVKTNV